MRFFIIILISLKVFAYDQDMVDRLKDDLEHDANRKKSYKKYEEEKKQNDKERDKGLALWLEEQEKWDLQREKSAAEFRKNRIVVKPLDESSPEYLADLELKKREERLMEAERQKHVRLKKTIIAQYQEQTGVTEEQELDIYYSRPRYDLRKRGKNKWVKSNSGGSTGSSYNGGAQSYDYGAPPVNNYQGGETYDFPPPPPGDFNSVPQDGFDDFPPPPPLPPSFDGNGNGTFDSGFGEPPMPPPPPPTDGSWDF